MKGKLHFEPMLSSHWSEVLIIYREGMDTGMATFETELPSWDKWHANHIKSCRLIARLDNEIIGWAALSPVSSRHVYRGVAEVTIYVAKKAQGNKVGKKLLIELINESEKHGFWTLQSIIFSENKASIVLHNSVGFRRVGFREKIGFINNQWKNNVLMERRSNVVGI